MAEINIKDYFSSNKAFLIAVSNYSGSAIPQLSSPEADARLLKKKLEEEHGFECTMLFNPGKTTLNSLLLSITPEENARVIIYFAGHGIAADNGSLEGYILPADTDLTEPSTFIAISELRKMLLRIKCKHLLLVLDCCFSGISSSSDNNYPGKVLKRTESLYFEKFLYYTRHKAWHVLASLSLANEPHSFFRFGRREENKGDTHSPFARQLANAISNGTDISSNAATGGIITMTELDRSLRAKLYPSFTSVEKSTYKGQFLFINPAFLPARGTISLPNIPQASPYKGLASYNMQDAGFFYGRQRVVYGWSGETGLKKSFEENNILVVCGATGSGKTSLLKAGLFPIVANTDDIVELTTERSLLTAIHILENIIADSTKARIVLVDQYERIFDRAEDNPEKVTFEGLLLKLAPVCKIIIAIRSGSVYKLKNTLFFKQIRQTANLSFKLFQIPAFTKNEIAEIIRTPAEQHLLYFKSLGSTEKSDEAFIEKITKKVFNYQELLPVLSLTLNELFLKQQNRMLLETVYRSFNGIEGILNFKINSIKEKYGEERDVELFWWLMLRMTSIQGGEITKRKVYTVIQPVNTSSHKYDELVYWYDHTTVRLKEMAMDLIAGGLIVQERDEDGRTFIQPAHDIILLHWDGLREWLNKGEPNNINEQARLMLHHAVSDSAMGYYSQSRSRIKRQYLWKDVAVLAEIRKTLRPRLNVHEEDFVDRSWNIAKRGKRAVSAFIAIAMAAIVAAAVFFVFRSIDATMAAKRTQSLSLLAMADASELTDGLNLLRLAYEKDSANPEVLNKIITVSEQDRDVNRFLSETVALSHHATQLEALTDSVFFYNGPGAITVHTPAGEKKIIIANNDTYPRMLLNTRGKNLVAYAHGHPVKVLDFEGNIIDSVVTGVQDPYGRVQFQWVGNRLIVELPGFVVARANSMNDTIKPRPGTSFTAVCGSPVENEIFLGGSDGSFFRYSFITKKLRFIRAGDQSIRSLALLPRGRICLISSDSILTILNSDFEKFNYLKGRKVITVQPFFNSSRLLLHTIFPSDSLMIWNYENGNKILLQAEPVDEGNITVSEDYLLTASKTTVKLWDERGNNIFNYRLPDDAALSGEAFFRGKKGFTAFSTSSGQMYSWHMDSSALYTLRYDYQDNDAPVVARTNLGLWQPRDKVSIKTSDDFLNGIARVHLGQLYESTTSLSGKQLCAFGGNKLFFTSVRGIDSFNCRLNAGELLSLAAFTKREDSIIFITNQGRAGLISVASPDSAKDIIHLKTRCYAGFSPYTNTICLKDSATGNLRLFRLNGDAYFFRKVNSEYWSLDSNFSKLCYAVADSVYITDIETKETTASKLHKKVNQQIVLSPGGNMFACVINATGTCSVILYGLEGGKTTGVLTTYHFTARENHIRAIGFSINENEIVVRFENNEVKNYLTPKGTGKWIREIKSAPLSTKVKERYRL